jgi:sodium-dependent dicarboxylate transporter 2/3/5
MRQKVGIVLGPLLALLLWLMPVPEDLSRAGWITAAAGLCMAVWWATEALPVGVTALLPLALFPWWVAPFETIARPYFHPLIFLFFGGFLVAVAIQRWGLHERIALHVIVRFGASGAGLVAGFMLASAALSMWVTNTATAMMLLPIALSVVQVVRKNLQDPEADGQGFPVAMLLAVAYGATIGGMATLVGTPPNALLAGFMLDNYGIEIGFGQWMLVGLPLTLTLLPLAWWLLVRRLYPVRFVTSAATRGHLRSLLERLGAMKIPERRIAILFFLLVVAWIARPLLTRIDPLASLTDPKIAVAAGLVLFLTPSGARGKGDAKFLLSPMSLKEVPWHLLLLFGGGLSLAAATRESGLAVWLGQQIADLGLVHPALLILAVTTLVIFLTELTSNLATTAAFLPVVTSIAAEAGFAPISFAAPAALAASCAFMLPVATPPNAVVYGAGMITIPQMVRAGFWLNLISIVLVTLLALYLAPLFLS